MQAANALKAEVSAISELNKALMQGVEDRFKLACHNADLAADGLDPRHV
jgi:hypothetical protein